MLFRRKPKVPCTSERCEYKLTKPFEQRCPLCYFRDKTCLSPAFETASKEEVLKRVEEVLHVASIPQAVINPI